MRIALPVLLLLIPAAQAATPPVQTPASMFDGRSEGRGVLTLLGRARPYRVDNVGHREPDGTFRLEQVVHFEGEPARTRQWRIRPNGAGRFVFTLSDAAGPGVAEADGATLRLRYAPRHLMRMHQVLVRNADGTLANEGSIRLLGIPVGHLVETIAPAP